MKIELVEGGKMPQRMSDGAVGYDCFAREVILHESMIVSTNMDNRGVRKSIKTADIHLGFKVDCSIQVVHPSVAAKMAYAGMLLPRSGWGANYGFRLRNTVGVIDPDYRGEVIMKVAFDRCPPELLEFAKSPCNGCDAGCVGIQACYENNHYVDRMAEQPRPGQLLFVPCYVGNLMQVDKLDDTKRGDGGFGSTNK